VAVAGTLGNLDPSGNPTLRGRGQIVPERRRGRSTSCFVGVDKKGGASLLLLKTHRVGFTGSAANQFIHPKITTHHDGFNRRKGELMTMTNVNSELPRSD
jgi:hypothetical protein